MAKAFVILVGVVLAVQGAVLRNDESLKRAARSTCDSCAYGSSHPGPLPPPALLTQNWSGYTKSADGQGVFSGAAAAAGDGSQIDGQTFSLAASGVAGGQDRPYESQQIKQQGQSQSDTQGQKQQNNFQGQQHENLNDTHGNLKSNDVDRLALESQDNFAKADAQAGGFEGQKQQSFNEINQGQGSGKSHQQQQTGGFGAASQARSSYGGGFESQGYQRPQAFNAQNQKQEFQGQENQGDSISYRPSPRYLNQQNGQNQQSIPDQENQGFNSENSKNQGHQSSYGQNEQYNQGYHGQGNQYKHHQGFNGGHSRGQSEGNNQGEEQNFNGSNGQNQLGQNSQKYESQSNSQYGSSQGQEGFGSNSGAQSSSFGEEKKQLDEQKSNGQYEGENRGELSQDGPSEGEGQGVGQNGQGYESVHSTVHGALNLANQSLQTAQQAACSTCGKSSYALSNAKSHSGSAIAISIGG